MALAEKLLRAIDKLGLLTRAPRLLSRISLVCAFLSLVWLLVLPLDGQYRNTYTSENALMPGQVTSYFRESEWNIVRGFREEAQSLEHADPSVRAERIISLLDRFGYVASKHSPCLDCADLVYGIMHAPRGDGTEAMVLAVPWKMRDGEYNEGGVALSLALARYWTKSLVWSKNIIIVYTENAHHALRLWTEAYHTTLEQTAGLIEAAVVIEYGKLGDHFSHFEIAYEGLNGQLPNLDLVHTAKKVGEHELLQCVIPDQKSGNTYWTRVHALFAGIARLALAGLSRSTPGCESFSGWQIQAITLRAIGGGNDYADVTQFGRVIDSTFRSVNNLLEKFHQSFFYYLLFSPLYFVSIGTYLPAAILVAAAFALSAVGTLVNSGVPAAAYTAQLGTLLLAGCIAEVCCWTILQVLPRLAQNAGREGEATIASNVLMCGTALSVAAAILSTRVYAGGKRLGQATSHGLVALALFFIALLVTALLIVHFSLALVIGLCALPLTFVEPLIKYAQDPKFARRGRVLAGACIFISNPAVMILLAGNLAGGKETTWMLGLLTSWREMQCYTILLVLLGWLPAWICVAVAAIAGDLQPQSSKKHFEK